LKRYFLGVDDCSTHTAELSCLPGAFQTLLRDLAVEDGVLSSSTKVEVSGDARPESLVQMTDKDAQRPSKLQKVQETGVLRMDAEKLNNFAEGRVGGAAAVNSFILDLIEQIAIMSPDRDAGRVLRQWVVDSLINEASLVPNGATAARELVDRLQNTLQALPAPPPSSQRKRFGSEHP
jgi:hypothetical protein